MLSKATIISHGSLLLTTATVSVTYEQSPLFGRPTQSSIIVLLISGFSLYFFRNLIGQILPSPTPDSTSKSFVLPNALSPNSPAVRSSLDDQAKASKSWNPFSRRAPIVSVALAVSLRIEIYRLILYNRQCMIPSFEGFVPLLFIFFDHWFVQRRQSKRATSDGSQLSNVPLAGNGKYLLSAACLGLANVLQGNLAAGPKSTYICPMSSSARTLIPCLQVVGLLFDCHILYTIRGIIRSPGPDRTILKRETLPTVSSIFLLSSVISSIGGILAVLVNSTYPGELSIVGWSYPLAFIWYIPGFLVFVISAIHIISTHGLLHLTLFVLCISTYVTGLDQSRKNLQTLDHPSLTAKTKLAASLVLFFVGAASYLNVNPGIGLSSRKGLQPSRLKPSSSTVILSLMIIFLGWIEFPPPGHVFNSHPIDTLMNEASERAKQWLDQASGSATLIESVSEYQRRYQRHPPPGFDAWYRYATARTSLVMDDYDTMMEDLQPFWGISPKQIRLLTQEVISDPWNEVSDVRFRNGRAALGPDFIPTHRWMLDGVIDLTKSFAQYIPDMDVAFNLNDEPRVAIPYAAMQKLRNAASGDHVKHIVRDMWSHNRGASWEPSEDMSNVRPFKDLSRINSFPVGSVSCLPGSHSSITSHWDTSKICTSCVSQHSYAGFLGNWTLSGSPCHQPDLRSLHGFYLSPAAFKPSTNILPIFSQSKVEGYADILYPSPWNYIDKVKYDPDPEKHPDTPFSKKENVLFWRGATSEGVSRAGSWKGMTRQRLVHLANNLTNSSRDPTFPILLPQPSLPGKIAYQTLPTNPIIALNLTLDISIVNGIARAWDNDGAAQDAEFGFAPATDFQDHWRYKYLMDVDGAGYSGRFLPFLQSRSLPFRTGIFRAWWDGRLTAWRHFVPIDVRLNGLFSTLVYFMGAEGQGVKMEGNVAAAEEIAEAGRAWAARVLRKEDMEIYMFRLLLEWGRLTDDKRDDIGFMG